MLRDASCIVALRHRDDKDHGHGIDRSWKLMASIVFSVILLLGTISNISMYANAQNSTDYSSEPASANSAWTHSSGNSTASTNGTNGSYQNAASSSSDNNSNATSGGSYESQNSTSTASNVTSTSADDAQQPMNETATEPAAALANVDKIVLSGEPLLSSNSSITREFSFPTLLFEGDVVSEVEVTITWNPDGTTVVQDSRGYQLVLGIPKSSGTVALFANSTVVDQRVAGADSDYDIYWLPSQNEAGYVNKYEFIIAGENRNASALVMEIVNSENQGEAFADTDTLGVGDKDTMNEDMKASGNSVSEDNVEGLLLDWSDAIESGFDAHYDVSASAIVIPVKTDASFFVDPYVVASTSMSISPGKTIAFQDQLRLVTTHNGTHSRLNAFYNDGSNIVYKTSDDEGDTWSSASSLSTGTIASNNNRWSITPSTAVNGTQYVHVFYWTKSGSTTTVYTKRGQVNGLAISWASSVQITTITNNESCSPGACVSVVATSDINGTIYSAFIWNTTGGTFSLVIKKSDDNGLTWSNSLSQINGTATNIFAMTLSELAFPRMLFAYAKGENANLYYRVFNGTTWGSEQSVTNNGMQAWTRKQLSSVYHESDDMALIAYTNVTTTNGGILKLARFFGNGTFDGLETADSTLRHYTPNILPTHDGNININSIADGMIYDTRKIAGVWEAPFNPYGMTFNSPDELTASTVLNGENAALWKEGTSAPYNITFAVLHHGLVEHSATVQNSPGYSDYFEGQRRVVSNGNSTLFAFHYDGSNIVYKKSGDFGHTWSGTATSTGTGSLASDNFRWTIAYAKYNDTDRVSLLYYKVSGSNTDFYAKTFKLLDSGLVAVSTVNLFSAANDASCSPTGTCAAATGSSDNNSTLYSAYRWKSGGIWHYKIMKSEDGGVTWVTSLNTVDVTTTSSRFPITITNLNLTKMLFAYATYESGDLKYRIFNGTAWSSNNTVTAGISTNTVKQISSDTVDEGVTYSQITAYLAFLTSGNQGTLNLAKFSSTGAYQGIETADSTINHWLPSVSVTGDGTVHAYTLYNNVIYDTKKIEISVSNAHFEYTNAGTDSSAIAYWPFENDTLDHSGNANNGTMYGNATIISGITGTAIDLDGVDDYVRVSDSSTLDLNSNITISAWVRLDQQTNDFRAILKKGGAYVLEKNNNNKPRFTIWSGGSATPAVLGTSTLQTDKWYHIVGTYDGNNLKIYVNGVLEGTQARTGAISTNNNDVFIGSGNSTALFIDAKLDEVQVYAKALASQEIQSIGTEWDLRGASVGTTIAIGGRADLIRPGQGDTRSTPIEAATGRLYTLDADVIVTSGTAKIDVVFLNASGTWLTNNTSPVSGLGWTSTTGPVQHLSASWIAPSNTVTAMIRLINNASGGSSRFDNVLLTSWESPVAPYGTELHYPDHLTAQVGGLFSTGVSWRSGSGAPYELMYAGDISSVVGSSNALLSPKTGSSFDGQKRLLTTSGGMFAFYHDGSNIVYKYSSNGGATWKPQNPILAVEGPIARENWRWTIAATKLTTPVTVKYVTVFYNKLVGTDTYFYARTAKITGTTLTWVNVEFLFAKPKVSGCFDSVCASITAATSTNNYMYAAFKYKPPNVGQVSTYQYQIWRSTDGGLSWSNTTLTISNNEFGTTNGNLAMSLTKLAAGKMLFAYMKYESTNIFYRVFSGSSWGQVQTISTNTNLVANSARQASADSDSTGKPYLAYTTKPRGELRVVTWSISGGSPSIESPDNTRTHDLPSITIRPNKIPNIYSISITSKYVSVTQKIAGQWIPPIRPYNDGSTTSANQLAVGIALDGKYAGATWTEGSSPYSIRQAGISAIGIAVTKDCEHEAKSIDICSKAETTFNEYSYSSPAGGATMTEYECGSSTCVEFTYKVFYTVYDPLGRGHGLNIGSSHFAISFGSLANPFRSHTRVIFVSADEVSLIEIENMIRLGYTNHFNTFVYTKGNDTILIDFVTPIPKGYKL